MLKPNSPDELLKTQVWLKVTRQLKQNPVGKKGVLKWNFLRSNIKGSKIKVDEVLTEQKWGAIWFKRYHSAFIQDSQLCPRLLQNLWGGNEFYPWPCSLFIAFIACLCAGGGVQTGPQPHQVSALSVQRGHWGWGPPLQGLPPPAGLALCWANKSALNRLYTINNIQSWSKSWDQWKTARIKPLHCWSLKVLNRVSKYQKKKWKWARKKWSTLL